MTTAKPHRHSWDPSTHICTTCGMTRGRASRAGGDHKVIVKFLKSAEVGTALHQAKLDPVLYVTIMSRLLQVADDMFAMKVAASTTTTATTPHVTKSATVSASTPKGRVVAHYDPATVTSEEPEVTVLADGTINVTVTYREA